MSEVEHQLTHTYRANGQKKGDVLPSRAPIPSMTAEYAALLEEEARSTKIAL